MPGDWLVRFDEGSLRFQTPDTTGTIPAFYSILHDLRSTDPWNISARCVPRRSRATRANLTLMVRRSRTKWCESTQGGPGATPRTRQPVQPWPAWGVCTAETRAPGDSTVPGDAAKRRADEKLNHTAARKGLPVRLAEDGAEPRTSTDDGYRGASGFCPGKSPPSAAQTPSRPGGRAGVIRPGP